MIKRLLSYPLPLILLAAGSVSGEDNSLYRRLGGEPVVSRVVEQAVAQVAGNPVLNHSFDKVNLKKLDKKIVEQICTLTGGGCTYSGDDMKTVHAGLDITEKEFYALVEAFRAALTDNQVGEREKNELLKILAPMKGDVVTR